MYFAGGYSKLNCPVGFGILSSPQESKEIQSKLKIRRVFIFVCLKKVQSILYILFSILFSLETKTD